jgi:hypothetical protein
MPDPYIYKEFDDTTDILYNQRELVTAPLWSNGQAALNKIFTSSFQRDTQQEYYYEVWNSQSSAQGAEPQFSIVYADLPGSGSGTGSLDEDLLIRPTRTNYFQYKQLLLPPGVDTFTFMDGYTSEQSSEYVYIININRSRFKDRVDTGNWQLALSAVSHDGSINATSSIVTLIDDSGAATTSLTAQGGRVYNVRSGSLQDGVKTNDLMPYGLFYPDNGIIVLNGRALDVSASLGTRRLAEPTTGSDQRNGLRLFTSISGAMAKNVSYTSFQGRTSEVIASMYYFARLQWNEFNYTNNDTFYDLRSGNYGVVTHSLMAGPLGNPEVFPTTVGLYDDDENLLAVAKLSKAIKKTYDHEMIIKIKLDY